MLNSSGSIMNTDAPPIQENTTNEQIRRNEATMLALNDRLRAAERLLTKEKALREDSFKRLQVDIENALNQAYAECQQQLKSQKETFKQIQLAQGKDVEQALKKAQQELDGFVQAGDANQKEIDKKIELNENKINYMTERATAIRSTIKEQITNDTNQLVKQEKALSLEADDMMESAVKYVKENEERLAKVNEEMIKPVIHNVDKSETQLLQESQERIQHFQRLGDVIQQCTEIISSQVGGKSAAGSRNASRTE